MKYLLIIRHAKSSWDSASISDFDRPLNDRGKKDAPMMAKRLQKNKISIDAFISSPAKRAKKTAELFAEEFEKNINRIRFEEALYHPSPEIFDEVISATENKFDTIAVFSHNPGVTDFVNTLTSFRTDNIPTCGIVGIKIHAGSWGEFRSAKKEFWFYEYPKSGD